jgi:hypothetical protein
MASAAFSPTFDSAGDRPSAVAAAAKRLVNALVASRVDAAERVLRRHRGFLHETALIAGEYRAIGLDKADLLPFNA